MRSRVVVVATLLLLFAASLIPMAYAADVTISLSDDKAEVTASIFVNMTAIPKAECDVYEDFYNMWRNPVLKGGFVGVVENYIEWYLRNVMGLQGVVVENLTIDYSLAKGYHTYGMSPASAVNTTGTLVSGSLGNLTAADGVVMLFMSANNTNTMQIIVDVNFSLPGWVPTDKLTGLAITVVGNLSKAVSDKASIELYDFSSGAYDVINASALNVTESTTVTLNVEEAWRYVKDKTICMRINVTDVQGYPSSYVNLSLDKVALSFEYFTITIDVDLRLVLSGVSNTTTLERMFNVKFRAMNPDGTVEYNAFKFSPARLFFINFEAFDVPLEKWTRSFNGTHTKFTYTVPSLTLRTHGGYEVTVDPTETIIVEGEAEAQGDTIIVKEVATSTWLLIGLLAVIVVVAVVIAATKASKHTIEAVREKSRKFIKKKQ